MYTHHLHQRVHKLEEQLKEQELAHGAFQQLFRDTELDNRAKDEYIKGMQTASTSSTREAARSPAIPVAKVANASQARTPLIVEDSQPKDYPQFASHTDIMGDQGGSQVLGNNEDLVGLFPATPKEQGHNVEVSQITYSSSRVTSRDAISHVKRGPALVRPGSQVSVHSNRKNRPSSSARASQPGFPAPRSEPGISPIKFENRQQSSQISGSVPRGILKPVMRDPRGEKRDADESGTNTTAGFTATKRRKSNMTKDLGPVVQDSQSPAKVISSRRRKQTTVRPKRKGEVKL